jgi:hypothetical protein
MDAQAAARASRRRHLQALRRLTAARYRAHAARIQRQQAVVRALRAERESCQRRLDSCRDDFRRVSTRLLGPLEQPLPMLRRALETARAEIRAQIDDLEAQVRSASHQSRRTRYEIQKAMLEARTALTVGTADEHRLRARHRRSAADLEFWTRIRDQHAEHDDERQVAILTPMVSRLAVEAAAIARCQDEQQDFVHGIEQRLAAIADEAEQRYYAVMADSGLAQAQAALASARRALSHASFEAAKKRVAISIADRKHLERLLEDKGGSGAAPAWIEERLLVQRQALEDLFQSLRALARLHGPPNRPPN